MDETTTVETETVETETTAPALAYVVVGAAATAVGFAAVKYVKAVVKARRDIKASNAERAAHENA